MLYASRTRSERYPLVGGHCAFASANSSALDQRSIKDPGQWKAGAVDVVVG
jgi:hypothetical protein